MTNIRTNQITEEQVEAAAKALRADEDFMEHVSSALEVSWSQHIARLVLEAALPSNDYTPDLAEAQSYYVAGRAQLRRQITGEQAIDVTEYSYEFDRMIAEVERVATGKALTDNRTNVITDEQVEATAKALAGIAQETPWSSCEVWGDLDEWVEGYRSKARAALEAALTVGEEELTELTEVIAESAAEWGDSERVNNALA